MTNSKTKGVYFIANDKVIELTIAFLNSFRKFNPKISLCLIPFNNDISEISKLQNRYNFTIYSDQKFLDFCDIISRRFHSETIGHYRKLAIWHGSFDEFVYIDIDTLVLKNIDFVFRLLTKYDFITSYSNTPSIRKWVWKDTIYETNVLSDEQINFAANTGFIVSKKNNITLDDIKLRLPDALQLSQHMELNCMEQPFLNYLIVLSDKRYSSLNLLLDSSLFPENYIEFWAGQKRKYLMKNKQSIHNDKLRDIFLIHWAGVWQLRSIDIKLFRFLRLLRIRKTIWSTRIFMPYKKLWKHYRFLD